jgi:hypothetical protein
VRRCFIISKQCKVERSDPVTCSPCLKARGFSGKACGNPLRWLLKDLPGPKRRCLHRRASVTSQALRLKRMAPRAKDVRAFTHGKDVVWKGETLLSWWGAKCLQKHSRASGQKTAMRMGHSPPFRAARLSFPCLKPGSPVGIFARCHYRGSFTSSQLAICHSE